MSVLLALLASGLWGVADFLAGAASRRLPVASVLGLSQLVALLGLVPVAALTGELDADRGYLLPAVLAGVVGVVALGAFYRALAVGTMGVVAPVAALGAAVPVVFGLARGEQPGALQLAGIAVAVVGVVLASGPEVSGRPGGAVPLALALVAAVGFGLVIVLLAEGARSSIVMTLLTMRLTSVVLLTVLLLVALPRRGPELGVGRRDLPLVAAVGLGDVGANAALAGAAATAGALVSVTGVLASLYPVVTVLLARQVLGERLRPVQAVGAGAALTGVALLAGG
ncbi:MAG: EamA family transporter [Actinomycetota bacterium]|nr:EamA family transporter [Actinomycetota bacterium]